MGKSTRKMREERRERKAKEKKHFVIIGALESHKFTVCSFSTLSKEPLNPPSPPPDSSQQPPLLATPRHMYENNMFHNENLLVFLPSLPLAFIFEINVPPSSGELTALAWVHRNEHLLSSIYRRTKYLSTFFIKDVL